VKVAFFVHAFPVLSESFIARQIGGLVERGHTVTVYSHLPAPAGSSSTDLSVAQRVVYSTRWNSSRARFLIDLGRTLRFSLASPVAAIRGLVAARPNRMTTRIEAFGRSAALESDPRPDVVHCHFGDLGLLYAVLADRWRVPLVVSFYGFDCSSLPRYHGPDVYHPLFRAAGALIGLSHHMLARLRELGAPPDLLHLVPLSVDPNVFRPVGVDDAGAHPPPRLLTVGRLIEKKGVAFAIEAIDLLREMWPEIRYRIVGDGPLRGDLERLTDALGLRRNVQFLGALDELSVAEEMAASDIFLLPSITASDGEEEGTPTVLIEAASTGLPVVATFHAGIPDIVEDGKTGMLVPERDVEALASAITLLLADRDRSRAMGAQGRKMVLNRFDTRLVAARLEEIYTMVIKGYSDGAPGAKHPHRGPAANNGEGSA